MEVDSEPFFPVAKRIFANDEANGRGDDIAYLRVSPFEAVSLALEGVITPDHVEKQSQLYDGPEGRYVDLLNVTIGGRIVTVRVMDDEETDTWTLDKDGVPIP